MAKLFTPLAVGAAVACLASAASAQTTQPEWHVPPDGWMRDAPDTFVPPLPGRVALDWVYGARYDRMMESFGGKGWFVEDPKDLAKTLDAAMAHKGPALVNVKLHPNAGRKPQEFGWLTT